MVYLISETCVITENIAVFHAISGAERHEILIVSVNDILQIICHLTFIEFNLSFTDLLTTVFVCVLDLSEQVLAQILLFIQFGRILTNEGVNAIETVW